MRFFIYLIYNMPAFSRIRTYRMMEEKYDFRIDPEEE